MTNSDKEVARFDIYKGNDIEGHIQELKAKYPEL